MLLPDFQPTAAVAFESHYNLLFTGFLFNPSYLVPIEPIKGRGGERPLAMPERTTTVQVDAQGRCYIPKAVRQSLGFEGEAATAELDVRLIEIHE